jgi:hypothetical protein
MGCISTLNIETASQIANRLKTMNNLEIIVIILLGPFIPIVIAVTYYMFNDIVTYVKRNNMMKKYRIIHNKYIDEFYNVIESYYTVDVEKSFLWFKYWRAIKHKENDSLGLTSEITKFSTVEEANRFVIELNKNNERQCWTKTIIKEDEDGK